MNLNGLLNVLLHIIMLHTCSRFSGPLQETESISLSLSLSNIYIYIYIYISMEVN